MTKHFLVSMCVLLALAISQVLAQDAERSLRDALLIPADFKLLYLDEKGAALAADEASRRMQAGNSMDVDRNDAAKTVTLRFKPPATSKSEIGEITKLPPLDLNDLYNRRIRNLDLAGRPTLINFFFETCVPCIKEAPVLNLYRARHREFNYLAVTFDSKEEARRFVQQRKLDWPVAYEADAFIEAMKVTAYPTYLLVASDGRILGRGSGMDPRSMDDPARALGEFEKWVGDRIKR